MQLVVLGGSAACPNPAQGCSGYLVSSAHTTLLLDCGPGTLPELLKHLSPNQLDNIIISHLHQDHIWDLIPLRYGLRYAPGLARRPMPLWLPPGGLDFLTSLQRVIALGNEPADDFFSAVFTMAEYDPSKSLSLGPMTIRFHSTRHWIPCWAMRIEEDQATLVYLADTGWSDDLIDFAHDADLLIVEITLTEQAEASAREGHLTPQQAGQLATLAQARQVLLTHYWMTPRLEEAVSLVQRVFSGPTLLARPGLTIAVNRSEAQ